MAILIGTTLLLLFFVFLMVEANYFSGWHTVGFVGTCFTGVVLFLLLLFLPINYYSGKAEVERYKVLKQTIENSRAVETSGIERAAILSEIAEYNKDLANVKYWNNTIFDWWIYDGLAELDFLE